MASHSLAIDQFVENLRNNAPFNKEAIKMFYEKRGEKLTDNLLAVRINRLKKRGVISPIAKGIYQISKNRPFHPKHAPFVKKLYKKIQAQYPFIELLIWETAWLNEFLSLQILNNWIIVEVEGHADKSVFEFIHELEPNRSFLDPGEKELEFYLPKKENPIIIKTLLTGSPKIKPDDIIIPKLEKILIDLFCDKLLDKIFRSERVNILNEAFKLYSVNYTTLLSYAARRGKKEEMAEIIKQNVEGMDAIIAKQSP